MNTPTVFSPHPLVAWLTALALAAALGIALVSPLPGYAQGIPTSIAAPITPTLTAPTPIIIYVPIPVTPTPAPIYWTVAELEQAAPNAPNLIAAAAPNNQNWQNQIDALINSLTPRLEAAQEKYLKLTNNKKYFQGYRSHSRPPSLAGDYPDQWFSAPTDQRHKWADIGILEYRPTSYALTIDTYTSPDGPGYVACYTVNVDGANWTRCINTGPDTGRSTPWSITP